MNKGVTYGIIGAAIAVAIGIAVAASMSMTDVDPDPSLPDAPAETDAPMEPAPAETDVVEQAETRVVDVGVLLPATGDLASHGN